MVAIPKAVADQVRNHDPETDQRGGSRDPLPEGHYLVRVHENEEEEAGANSDYAKLKVVLEVVQPREHKGTWLWDRLSYSPKATWKMWAFFDAFDYDSDSDVDEIQDDEEATAVVFVKQQIIKAGAKKGELSNEIGEYLPADDENLDLVED